MARSLSAQMQAVATADVVRPFLLIDLDFDAPTGTVRLWTGHGDITFNSNTYAGAGDVLSIDKFSESIDLEESGITLNLTGLNPTIVEYARDKEYQGRTATVRFGALDGSGNIISDPIIVFQGFMDTMSITDAGESANISLTIESKMIALDRVKVRRYTPEDLKLDYPSDKGLDFVPSMQETEITWGGKLTIWTDPAFAAKERENL